jgi:N-acetyl sugar amidotransferase
MNRLPKISRPGEPGYRQCLRTIMDTTDPDIRFNHEGISNHVDSYEVYRASGWNPEGNPEALSQIIARIKKDGRGKKYDCILGLSGGLDSSYLAAIAHESGLRTLIFHTDTGWNTEIAVNNIESIARHYDFPLHTHVIDWNEMADVQRAFLRAGVPNQDIPQDHAIFAAFYTFAARKGIKWVLSGSNYATESVLPSAWGYDARDAFHLRKIHGRYGERSLGKFPLMGHLRFGIEFTLLRGMKVTKALNLVPYRRKEAIERLSRETGWQYYGAKHFESRWTRFFQAYWLPEFFGYDKRLAHLSSLILTGEITKEEAQNEMKQQHYSPSLREEDIELIARKLKLRKDEVTLLKNPSIRSHFNYPTSHNLTKNLISAKRVFFLKNK